jgi:hypothetical protein
LRPLVGLWRRTSAEQTKNRSVGVSPQPSAQQAKPA